MISFGALLYRSEKRRAVEEALSQKTSKRARTYVERRNQEEPTYSKYFDRSRGVSSSRK